jgi:hypothetical protein
VTHVAIDTLRIRGPVARRLATVAARALPAALERALADVADVTVDTVEVMLELDPDDYDDETLAILWADAIRARVLAAGDAARSSGPHGPSASTDPAGPAPDAADVLAAARLWLAARDGATDRPLLPGALLALGDGPTARMVAGAARPDEWSRLVAALGAVLPCTVGAGTPVDLVASAMADPADQPAPPTVDMAPEAHAVEPAAEAGRPSVEPTLQPADEHGVLRTLSLLADLAPEPASAVDPAAITRAAGLVLLYPWLADHCRLAVELHPGLDALDVREAALAAVVDPDDRTLADDPLVALLAGRPDPRSHRARTRIQLPGKHDVAESATRVLAAFAALLPGFERSTPAFVRQSWIARLGLLDPDRQPILLTAAIHPLDVMLPRLPYPVGLIKLPWSPPLSVRFR